MLTIKDLKRILSDNHIQYFSFWDKKDLIEKVKENGLTPEEIPKSETVIKLEPKWENINDSKYDRLKTIAKNPRKVTLQDIETGEIHTFPSIFKAGKFIKHCPQTISNWDGRVWKNKYKINVNRSVGDLKSRDDSKIIVSRNLDV